MLFDEVMEVIDAEPHSAALNMAIDEILLRSVHTPLLRFYRWSRPAISFGYFGKWDAVITAWPTRDIVRRWTGGGVVPHGEDVTYSLVVPREHRFFTLSPQASYATIHEQVACALGVAVLAGESAPKVSDACFENAARHDVVMGGRKVAGAAQRRTKHGLLHQGSIQCLGAGRMIESDLRKAFAAQIHGVPIALETLSQASRLAEEKYASAEWMRRY